MKTSQMRNSDAATCVIFYRKLVWDFRLGGPSIHRSEDPPEFLTRQWATEREGIKLRRKGALLERGKGSSILGGRVNLKNVSQDQKDQMQDE